MRKEFGIIGLLSMTGIGLSGAGCVSLEEHDQLKMHNRTLAAEKEHCEQELYDSRAAADSLRTRVQSLEGELGSKGQLVSTLQSENDQLERSLGSAQSTVESLAGKSMPNPVVIEKSKLPEPLDSALKEFAAQNPGQVEYDAKRGVVKWKSDVVFPLGSDVVKETAVSPIRSFVEILKSPAAANFEVVIVGHTDDRPIKRDATAAAHPTNWHLSVHRSIAVSKLILDEGYSPTSVGVMGYGEFRPAVPNDGEENRSKNRRVEIFLVEKGSTISSAEGPNVLLVPGLAFAFAG